MCGKNPVSNAHAKYCESCREIAKQIAEEKKKESRIMKRKQEREKKKIEKREKEINEKRGKNKTYIKCVGCAYYRLFYGSIKACHYTLDTGKLKTIPAIECYKHEGTPYKPVKN